MFLLELCFNVLAVSSAEVVLRLRQGELHYAVSIVTLSILGKEGETWPSTCFFVEGTESLECFCPSTSPCIRRVQISDVLTLEIHDDELV